MNRNEINDIVIKVISEYLLSQQIEQQITDETPLFGEGAILDSMGLVNIVIDLESEFLDRGVDISLTSENAMSRRQSPFRMVSTLIDIICEQTNVQ